MSYRRYVAFIGVLTLGIILTLCVILTQHPRQIGKTVIVTSVDRSDVSADLKWSSDETGTDKLKLVHWLPDWYNKTDIGLVLSNRVEEVKRRCRTYSTRRNNWNHPPVKKLSRSRNLEYCHTAKAGSTFWRELLHRVKEKEENLPGDKLVSGYYNCLVKGKILYETE